MVVPSVNGVAAMLASAGCTIVGEVYVPGQLHEIESPALDALTIRNCALSLAVIAHAMSCALALRGFIRNHAGSPVATARRPT